MSSSAAQNLGACQSIEQTAAGKRAAQSRSHKAFVVVAMILGVALAASGAPSPLYVEYAKRWHVSQFELTIVYAAYAAGVIATLLLFSGLSDQLGRRRVLVAGSALLGLSMVEFVAAQDLPMLLGARLVQGVATGLITGAAAPALTELHPRRDPRASGMVNGAVTSAGITLGALASGACAQWLPGPLRVPYLLLAIATVATLVLIVVVVPETVALNDERARALLTVQRFAVPPEIRRRFWVACACVVAAWSVAGVYLALGGALVSTLLHMHNHLVVGLVILLVQGVGGATQIVLRRLDDRTSARAGLLCLIGGVALVAGALRQTSAGVFVIGDLVTGIGFGLAFMSGTRRANRAAPPDRRGAVMAAYFLVAYLAISVPVLVVARIADHLGLDTTYDLFAAAMAVLCLLALVGVETLDRRQ